MLEIAKNDIVKLDISGYSSEGHGVARHGMHVVFVRHALDGETVEALILSVKKHTVYAKIHKIIKPSPERNVPDCAIFGKCGGCGLLHMSYAEELRYKRIRVEDTFLNSRKL